MTAWIISNGHISATAHWIHLYSAHHVVVFALAQLSCFSHCNDIRFLSGFEDHLVVCSDVNVHFFAVSNILAFCVRCKFS